MATNNSINLQGPTPAFRAYRTVNTAAITGDGSAYAILFNGELFDLPSNYAPGTGLFTAPITAKYLFYTNILLSGLAAGHTTGSVTINDIASGNSINIFDGNPYAVSRGGGIYEMSGSGIISLTAGDTVGVSVTVSGGALAVSIGQYAAPLDSNFGGYLITIL